MKVYLNGKIVPKEKALVSVFDHGFLYGDGIYETLMVYNGKIFKIDEHIKRFFQSAKMTGFKMPMTKPQIEAAFYKTLKANNLKEAYIRIQITRGYGDIGLDPALCPKPTVVIIPKDFHGHPEEYYQRGVHVAVVNIRRNHPMALNPKIKATNFLNNILAKIESLKKKAYEAIMLTIDGYVAEGTICNIFIVKNRTLITPPTNIGILEGVTRTLIIKLAKEKGIKVLEKAFKKDALYSANECFLSSTTMEIMPVTRVDNKKIGKGLPGEMTKGLLNSFREKYVRPYYK
ncbi:MAG: branched-chain-amino-acid transaminase [Nitrospirae bacterium]|nr:branched-chain-amino-acid transaminase [Nitrospirota bacterium]